MSQTKKMEFILLEPEKVADGEAEFRGVSEMFHPQWHKTLGV
jgi:hypothetical protein